MPLLTKMPQSKTSEERRKAARGLIEKACSEGAPQSSIEETAEEARFGFSVSIAYLGYARMGLPTPIEVDTTDFVAEEIDCHYLLQEIKFNKYWFDISFYSKEDEILISKRGISDKKEEAAQRLKEMAENFEQQELTRYRNLYRMP